MQIPLRSLFLSGLILASGPSYAADCHDVSGTWDFALKCIAYDTGTGAPFTGDRNITGEITKQEGCVFYGELGGLHWAGALHGDQNKLVSSDYGAAKATGELSRKRAGLFQDMSLTYTFSNPSIPSGGPLTACTGSGTRR